MKQLWFGLILMALSLGLSAAEVSPADIDRLHQDAKQAFFAADYPTALAKWQTALSHARALGHKQDISKFLVNLGAVNLNIGQYQQALDYYQQALVIDRELGDKSGESADLSYLGLIQYSLGQYQPALTYYQQALAIQRKIGDKGGQSHSLGNLVLLYDSLGQYPKALEYGEQALALHREMDDKRAVGNDLSNLGMVYDNLGQHHKALEYYQNALPLQKALSDKSGIGKTLSGIGAGYKNLGDYPKALAHFQQSIAIHEQIGDIRGIGDNLANLGAVYDSLGQYPKALKSYQQALQIQGQMGNISGIAQNFSNLGLVYANQGQYPKALAHYRQALQIYRRMGEQRGIGNTLSNLGIVYKSLGDFPKALTHYQQALEIQREIGDGRGEASTLTNMGMVYDKRGQYSKALKHFLQALEMQRQIGDKHRIAHNLSNLGVLYYHLKQSEKALGYFLQALTIKREIGDKRGEGSDLSNAGAVYDSLGLPLKALRSYLKALAIRRELGDKHGEATDLSHLGAVYGNVERYQLALTYFQEALVIARELGDKSGEAADLANIGLIYQQLGQYEPARTALQDSVTKLKKLGTTHRWYAQRGLAAVEAKLNNTDAAITHYEQTLAHVEKLRAGLTDKTHRLSFMQDKLYVYDDFITLLQRLHDEHPDKGYDRKALEIFERKQGRVFLEEIGKSGAQRFAHLPYEIVQEEQLLIHKVAHTETQLVQARNKPFIEQDRVRVKALTQRVATLEAALGALQTTIKEKYPAYHALKYPQPTTAMTLQQEVLQADEAILIYGVMRESTLLWVISPKQFAMFTLPAGEEEIEEDVAYMRDVILNRLPEMVDEGFPLYEKLIPEEARELLADAHTLYIVPTGPLYALPFETLVSQETDYDNPHYLIKDYAIVYLSSASVLKVLRDTRAGRTIQPSQKFLAFADPAYASCQENGEDENNRAAVAKTRGVFELRKTSYRDVMGAVCFPRLPNTANEANAIATLFQASDTALYLGEQANRDAVLYLNKTEQMNDYRYVLFALHGLLPDEVKGLAQSALVLSNDFLTMADAFALQLNADFINLSACNTGGGDKLKGEGIMGLTRAFMYAGTQAISVTLWSVESASAKNLSIGIFENLSNGKNAADALRQIKLKMIAGDANKPYYRHPFYWAPFVVYGDGG